MLNLIDLCLLALFLIWMILGAYRGFLSQIRSFIPLISSLCVFFLLPLGMEIFGPKAQIPIPIGIIAAVSAIGLYPFWNTVFFSLKMGLKMTSLNVIDSFLGMVFGALQALVYSVFFVFLISLTPLSQEKIILKSKAYSFILSYLRQIPFQYLSHRVVQKTSILWVYWKKLLQFKSF